MSIKSAVKKFVPAHLWEYMRQCKHNLDVRKRDRLLFGFLINNAVPGFIMLDECAAYDSKNHNHVFDGEQYYSQAYQDYFLDRYVFERKRHGFFLDIGGNDPISINNTYFFEKSREWTGLAFEPIESQRAKWKPARKTECLPYALGSTTGEAEFCEYDANAMSGFVHDVNFSGSVKARYSVPVRRLADILEERGINHVDLVSLDVEGAELEVLKGIDFSKVNIECFTIENDKGPSKEKPVIRFMLEAGYQLKARLWLDDVWVKRG